VADDERFYFLLGAASHRMRVVADRRCLERVGITAAQAGAMWAIEERPGATQRDVAQALNLVESAVTTMMGRLLDAGMVKRTRSKTDARAWTVSVTPKGRKALAEVAAALDDLNADMLAGVSAQQRKAMGSGLRKVLANATAGD
jgi:DNA-binding MarR family transcriptional regulator